MFMFDVVAAPDAIDGDNPDPVTLADLFGTVTLLWGAASVAIQSGQFMSRFQMGQIVGSSRAIRHAVARSRSGLSLLAIVAQPVVIRALRLPKGLLQICVSDGAQFCALGKARICRDFEKRTGAAKGIERQALQAFFLYDEIILTRRENHL